MEKEKELLETFSREIDRRDRERAIMLRVSNDIVTIRDKKDLLKVINTRLKELIYFTHNVMTTTSEGGETYNAFLRDPNSRGKISPQYEDAVTRDNPVNDNIYNIAEQADQPIVLKFDDYKDEAVPLWFKVNQEAGAREMMIKILPSDKVSKHGLILFSDQDGSFDEHAVNIIQSLSFQLATASANIVANEEIERRDQEKSKLLSFSNDLARVKEKHALGLTISHYLKYRFDFDEYILALWDEDEREFSCFLTELPLLGPGVAGIDKLEELLIDDHVSGHILRSRGPYILTHRELNSLTKNGRKGLNLFGNSQFSKIAGIKLSVADQNVGLLIFRQSAANETLLNGISAQIAVAVANTLANGKLERQLEEINKYKVRLEEENLYLLEQIESNNKYSEIIGNGKAMQSVFMMISKVAFANTTVLVQGETGTGKELVARAVHQSSPRRNKLLVKVNCAALPANLIESELFGHEKGSFTGAVNQHVGKFELASGGTIFLDEIGELPLSLQGRLLRVLQEREIERIGGRGAISVDVRIIAATNRDLKKEVAEGRFRKDLYFRLDVFQIEVPPLRDRKEDIPHLVIHYLNKFVKKNGRKPLQIAQKVMNELMAYDWPGNVRELEHMVERTALLTRGEIIREVSMPEYPGLRAAGVSPVYAGHTLEDIERSHILNALSQCNGKVFGKGGAAEFLGLHVSTLNGKMRKLNIKRKQHYQTAESTS